MKKIFIICYRDIDNNYVFNYSIESKNKRNALKIAYQHFNPNFDDASDEYNQYIKSDFYENAEIIGIITGNNLKIKLY